MKTFVISLTTCIDGTNFSQYLAVGALSSDEAEEKAIKKECECLDIEDDGGEAVWVNHCTEVDEKDFPILAKYFPYMGFDN